ncbi:MAG: hypothetical protein A2176_08995 [Spirochaetes bacterium RBG_13_51_14]|nr:MAG: hypothetical protein A2176_08995 [Spirochaetes bacterium RBG_13_51_14]
MEDIPKINRPSRIPITIGIPDYLRDHEFRGQAVLPAVEAMRVLAESATAFRDDCNTHTIINADFARFLNLEPGAAAIEAFTEIESHGTAIRSKLITVRKSGKTSISRGLEHASLTFDVGAGPTAMPPLDVTLGLEGVCLDLDRDRVYGDLIPFKNAYRNIEKMWVSEHGALALVNSGTAKSPGGPLGSPFPLDASFHAACVWGQRFCGIVGFPVHFDRRIIRNRTRAGESYMARIIPVSSAAGLLVFDLWIYDTAGELFEEVRGLHMKDVSDGTILPPPWIRADGTDLLESIRARCADLSVIELATITKPCENILSGPERERFSRMREKRGVSFLAARMALKKLSRRLPGNDMNTPSHEITTITDDGLPLCPLSNGSGALYCTASHDSRFAVAAVSEHRIGIDVEAISERVLKGRQLYMHEEEIALADNHPLGTMEASIRVWTIKEAVAKALGISLPEGWRKTRVYEIGNEKSDIRIDAASHYTIHATVDGHVFTFVKLI